MHDPHAAVVDELVGQLLEEDPGPRLQRVAMILVVAELHHHTVADAYRVDGLPLQQFRIAVRKVFPNPLSLLGLEVETSGRQCAGDGGEDAAEKEAGQGHEAVS
jgi:hypothetical protein